ERNPEMTVREEDSRTADRLWAGYARTRDPRTRDALVHQFERLAYSIANRFVGRGTESEDLFQVAMVGLVKAVDRFDPTSSHRFATFATPTILGEIRRHFRDTSWNVHVPRPLQEHALHVRRAEKRLYDELGREPTAMEIAARLELTEEQVVEVLSLEQANRTLSLDGEFENADTDRPSVLASMLGEEDTGLRRSEDRVSIHQALRHL